MFCFSASQSHSRRRCRRAPRRRIRPHTPASRRVYARDRGRKRHRAPKLRPHARSLLLPWISAHPADARALFDLGYIEDAENHPDAAVADYKKSIEADPKQFESRLSLGLLLARQGNSQEALEQLTAASHPPAKSAQPRPPRRRPSARWPGWNAPATRPPPNSICWKPSGSAPNSRTICC